MSAQHPDRCPRCSFQPTSLNDYCDEHRPTSAISTRAPWPEIRRVRAALGLSLRETNRALMRYGSADAAIAAALAEPDRESFEAAERVRLAAPELLEALRDALEFIEDQEDVADGSDGQPAANRAMQLAESIRTTLSKATGSRP